MCDSIVVSIPRCHRGDRGSIPRRAASFFIGSRTQRSAPERKVPDGVAAARRRLLRRGGCGGRGNREGLGTGGATHGCQGIVTYPINLSIH